MKESASVALLKYYSSTIRVRYRQASAPAQKKTIVQQVGNVALDENRVFRSYPDFLGGKYEANARDGEYARVV